MGTSRHADAARRRRRAITLEDRDFILGAAAWIAKTDVSTIDVGLSPDEALHRAPEFLRVLREGKVSPAEAPLDDASIDVLHAACRFLAEANAGGVEEPLDSARALYDFIEKVTWPGPDFDARAELLAACAFAGWRISRREAVPPETHRWHSRVAETKPLSTRGEIGQADFHPDDPETVLRSFDELLQLAESDPSAVLDQSTLLYRRLEEVGPNRSHPFAFGELEYFLGETARLAGAVSRVLAFRNEARRWFDLADGWFLQTENADGELAKVAYQRLALRTEERDFSGVFELLPQLTATFERLEMSEDAIKSRFLLAAALRETERLPEAIDLYKKIVTDSKALRSDVLLAHAYTNLAQLYGFLGHAKEALELASEATPLLRSLGNHVTLAKLQWGVGFLQRFQGKAKGAIESFRLAQQEFQSIEMRADVAAVQLVIADLLLDVGQEKQAEWEIRQALPLIDEYKLVPEGLAAMTLLRESLRRQKIDRQALRNLHGYFEERKS